MTHPFWFSEERRAAWGLLLAVIALNLGIVYINVLLNNWNNTFYNALQDKNYTVFLHQLIRFSWLAGLFIVFAVYQFYLNQMLQIRWRRWLTEHYLRGWFPNQEVMRLCVDRGVVFVRYIGDGTSCPALSAAGTLRICPGTSKR